MPPARAAVPAMRREFATSADLRAYVRGETGPRVLLSCSTGKDSIATWIALRESGFDVVPFYLYLVPGLEFVEESLAYYERHFGTRIMRFPSPTLYRLLRNGSYQPPHRIGVLRAMGIPALEFAEIENEVRKLSRSPDAFTAIGVRAADSQRRRFLLRRNGPLTPHARKFAAVFDWRMRDITAAITREGVALPIDYRLFGRTFDSIVARYLVPMREHLPRDYARVLEWFPLADLDLFRRGLIDGPTTATATQAIAAAPSVVAPRAEAGTATV